MSKFFALVESSLHKLAHRLARNPSVLRHFRRLDQQSAHHANIRKNLKITPSSIFTTWLVLVGIGVFFVYHIKTQMDWPPAAYSDPAVLNLTDAGVKWDYYYGDPVSCGENDCHVLPDYPVESYTGQAVLPQREFPLLGYEKGQHIYYRMRLSLPANLLDSREVLYLHTVYIWARNYEFYVDGHLIDSGETSLLNLPVPKHLVQGRRSVTLAFKIDPGELKYQGISNYGSMVLGPKSLLQPLAYVARDIRTTHFLWFLLPRVTICLLFGFIFLAMPKNRENYIFLLFVLTSSVKIFLTSEYASELLPDSVNGLGLVQHLTTVEGIFFIVFIHHYFRRPGRIFVPATTALVLLLLVNTLLPGGLGLNLSSANRLTDGTNNLLRLAGLIYAVGLAGLTSVYLAWNQKSRVRLQSAVFLGVFLTISTIVTVLKMADLVWVDWARGVINYSHELLLSIILAGLVALEFGSTVLQRDKIKSKFSMVVDAKLAESILDRPETMRGKTHDATVLFCDIRSFTTISEIYPAEEVVEMLNAYFDVMVPVINHHGGVVDKFIGDAIMAVFGIPNANPGADATAAVACAVEMRRELRLFNKRRIQAGKFPVSIGIGVHSGRLIAGGIGSSRRIDYTVIGDPVNTAARLESMTKELGADILISENALNLARDQIFAAYAGDFKFKGKTATVKVYRLIGVFVQPGQYRCYDDAYATLVPAGPGQVIESGIRNLATYTYQSDGRWAA